MKKFAYILCAVAIVGWVVFRFAAIGSEHTRYVFNAARVSADHGAPVEVLEVSKKTDVLKEPLAVKNNRAYVSGARIDKFAPGQKVGDGVIVSVSYGIDLDSGMHVIKTRGVKDGMNYAQSKNTGYFVPAQAVRNGAVMVAIDGAAKKRDVKVTSWDSETAVITNGLSDGDKIILSKIAEDSKVKF
jgi:hypothetical protein